MTTPLDLDALERLLGQTCMPKETHALLDVAIAELRAARQDAALVPELLRALKLLAADVEPYEAWQRPCYALDVARAAIAKGGPT